MKSQFAIIAIATLTFAAAAAAQEPPPDIRLVRTGGVYAVNVEAPADTDLVEVCLVRADHDPVEPLGCVAAGPSEIVSLDIQVTQTTFDDAEIRAYARDDDALVSELSLNKGDIDFTPPGQAKIRP
jgi:hypothetical protein